MKFQLFSDLHMEFFRRAPALGAVSVHPEADAVVLAGDIDSGEDAFRFAYALGQKFGKPVIFVPGNHEIYNHDYFELEKKYRASARDGVHVLLDDTVVINGVRFIGGTLWTDFRLYEGSVRMPLRTEAFDVGRRNLADFRMIREGDAIFTPERSAERHANTLAYIERLLAEPFDGPTVVVTHHSPHEKSIHPRYSADQRVLNSPYRLPNENPTWPVNVCFASRLARVVSKANVWCHGHVHDSFDYPEGDCRVIANPRGYPKRNNNGDVVFENPAYEPLMLIQV